MEEEYIGSISGRRWAWTTAPRYFGIFWIGGRGGSLIILKVDIFAVLRRTSIDHWLASFGIQGLAGLTGVARDCLE
jgi:hypothetical protein